MLAGPPSRVLLLLLFLFALSTAQEAKDTGSTGNILFRLLCYNHSSALTLRGDPCDRDSPCDPEFQFCLSSSQADATQCALARVNFAFADANVLGACSAKTGVQNFPDPVLAVPMTRKDLQLRLRIQEVDKMMLFERRKLIDEVKMEARPAELPVVADGQPVTGREFARLSLISRVFRGPGKPLVEVGAILQCAPGRFGPLCAVTCNANEKYDCQADGSRRCRLGWAGSGCEERDFCASRPCKPWAACHSLPGSFECSCDGRTGPQCHRDADPCLNHRCANSAPCLGVQGRPVCLCPPGLKGLFCTKRDLCHPNPCASGRCAQNASAQVTCHCPKGRRGRFCEISELTRPLATAAAGPTVDRAEQKFVKAELKVGSLQEKEQEETEEFPMLFVLVGAGVGVLLLAVVIVALSCALRKKKQTTKTQRKGTGPRLDRVRVEQPLNPYNDQESIYEEPEAVYSTEPRDEAPPTPLIVKGEARRQVFVRQDSRC